MKHLKKIFLFSLTSLVAAAPTFAIPWQNPDFYYFAQDEELKDLLRNFSLSQGINAVISPEVEGKVSGLFEDIAPEDFMNQISKAYGLLWFYDGNVLYVDPFDQIVSHIAQVQYYDAVRFQQMLTALDIEGSNFALKSLDKQGLMLISGSPRFVRMAVNILSKLEANESRSQGRMEVAVFPLNFSWAYDLSLKVHNNRLKVPGVASVISSLMSGGQMPSTTDSTLIPAAGQDAPSVASLSSIGAESSSADVSGDNSEISASGDVAQPQKQKTRQEQRAGQSSVIRADVRLNAVIVRDIKEKLPLYESLIQSLDAPVDVVEIESAIVNLDTNYSLDLGNKFIGGSVDNTTIRASLDGSSVPGASGVASALTTGFNIGADFKVAGKDFISQIQVLEKQGHAKLVSRPTIVTLDNIEAAITNTTVRFVSVTSTEDAKLFNVEAGTVLKVTPHVIENIEGLRKIKLLVQIQDGSDTSDAATNETKTSNSEINTQAVVYEGESLLLGGFFTENKSKSDSGIPVIGKIPVLGHLFKSSTKSTTTTQKLFLITPRVVTLSYGDQDNYGQYFEGKLHGNNPLDKSVLLEEAMKKQKANKTMSSASPLTPNSSF